MEDGVSTQIWEKMAQFSLDMLCTIDRDGNFKNVSNGCKKILGYDSNELVGHRFTEFLHPGDFPVTVKAAQDISGGSTSNNFENSYIHKDGNVVPLLWSAVWSDTDKVFFCVARDVTERNGSKAKLAESEQRYKALFENNPDIIFLQSKEGLITEVNQSFCHALGIPRHKVVNQPATTFLPPDMVPESEKTFQQAMAGAVVKYNIELITKDKERRIFDAIKQPVVINGEVVGIQTIAKDITPIQRSLETIQQQANKLNTIFESITDAFFTLNRNWEFTYINREAARILQLDRDHYIGKNVWQKFPAEINGEFYKQYHLAVDTGSAIQFEAYYKGADIWLEVKAFPSAEGLSVYFSDITDKIIMQQELEKLSLVASKTTHGVIITDADGLTEWVNNGFTNLTGFLPAEIIGKKPGDLLQGAETDQATVQNMREKLQQAVPFNTIIINYKKSGEKVWLSIDITPVINNTGKLIRFIAIHKDISERIEAQQKLKKLSWVASNTTNGVIITDSARRIEWVNAGFTKLTDYSLEEVIGKIPSEFLHNENTDTKAFELVKDKMIGGEPVAFEILNCKKSGEEIWLFVQVNPVHNENGDLTNFVTVQTDITERIKSQKELEKLSLVASKTNNGVFIANKDWQIEWVNDGFTRLMGYSMAEAMGKRPSELLHSHKTDKKAFAKLESKLLKGEPVSFEILNLKKNGEEVWLSVEITAILDENGAISKFIEVQTDITALKKTELELSHLAKDLYRQNSDLQQFTYIVSHNLRSPVATALGLADLLTKIDKESEYYNPSLDNLKLCVSQLDLVLRDVNAILSVRDNKENLEQEQVDVNCVLQQALSALQEPLQKSGGKVISEIKQGLFVKANKAYLYSIFNNLLSNAIKYRSEARVLEVRIRCFCNSEKGMLLSFSDNGSGFDMKKAKDNIFKLYKRFHADKQGRGIGLYLVKTHLEAMGGHIEVTSQVGVGTRFLIYLPLI